MHRYSAQASSFKVLDFITSYIVLRTWHLSIFTTGACLSTKSCTTSCILSAFRACRTIMSDALKDFLKGHVLLHLAAPFSWISPLIPTVMKGCLGVSAVARDQCSTVRVHSSLVNTPFGNANTLQVFFLGKWVDQVVCISLRNLGCT